jgi:hypothetical protein
MNPNKMELADAQPRVVAPSSRLARERALLLGALGSAIFGPQG